jgi:hypothetical protein
MRNNESTMSLGIGQESPRCCAISDFILDDDSDGNQCFQNLTALENMYMLVRIINFERGSSVYSPWEISEEQL